MAEVAWAVQSGMEAEVDANMVDKTADDLAEISINVPPNDRLKYRSSIKMIKTERNKNLRNSFIKKVKAVNETGSLANAMSCEEEFCGFFTDKPEQLEEHLQRSHGHSDPLQPQQPMAPQATNHEQGAWQDQLRNIYELMVRTASQGKNKYRFLFITSVTSSGGGCRPRPLKECGLPSQKQGQRKSFCDKLSVFAPV